MNRSISPNSRHMKKSETEKIYERNHKLASQINIIEQLNEKNLETQEHEIEIERL